MPYPIDLIRAIAERHSIPGEPVLQPQGGMVNEAWRIGDHILRIVMEGNDEECDVESAKEAAVVPRLRAMGVRTPELVAAETKAGFGPRPYTIYRFERGRLIGFMERDDALLEPTYRELGRQIAIISSLEITEDLRPVLRTRESKAVRSGPRRAHAAGALTDAQHDEVVEWLAMLQERFEPEPKPVFVHFDLHPWNAMSDPETGELTAILDWGDVGIAPVAVEFACFPADPTRLMLEGYAEAGGKVDRQLIAGALLSALELALWEARSESMKQFQREWWRYPAGGWEEWKADAIRLWPEVVG